MSTETKIGLIIGLGFIVCFAVLLANSDPEQKSAVQWAHVVDGVAANRFESQPRPKAARAEGDAGFKVAGARAVHFENVSPPREHTPAYSERSWNLPLQQPVSGVMEDRRRAAASSSPRPDQSVKGGMPTSRTLDSSVATSLVETRERDRLRDYLDARQSSHAQPAAVREPTPNIATRATTSYADEAGGPLHDNAPRRTPRRSNTPARGGSEGLRRHVVVAGDTLTRIANKYYGSQSKKVVDAVFTANRSILPDADHLALGMTITLPRIEGLAHSTAKPIGAGGVPPAHRSTKKKPRPTIQKASPTWYQIKKNDRYVSIARAQLGDGSRWSEIHELNKDRFPDPERIQWGVRIRLPAVNLASARIP